MATILYGSETGTAEDVAWCLHAKLSAKFEGCLIRDLSDYDFLDRLPLETFVIFVVATTGEGDAPSSMKKFWSFMLRKNLPPNSLENLRYTVFGLGDSGYEKFNSTARRLNIRLKQVYSWWYCCRCIVDRGTDSGWGVKEEQKRCELKEPKSGERRSRSREERTLTAVMQWQFECSGM
jgi:sulfite reductase alpha subunit-like flavoprotein